jgi:hypothetical protein
MKPAEQVLEGKALLLSLVQDAIARTSPGAVRPGIRWIADGSFYSLTLTVNGEQRALKVSESVLRECACEAHQGAGSSDLLRRVEASLEKGLRAMVREQLPQVKLTYETLLFRA